jgi:hypothetical protein
MQEVSPTALPIATARHTAEESIFQESFVASNTALH